MQSTTAKQIGIYDVPPSAVVGLMAIPERDRVVVEFESFDDIEAGHIAIPYKRRDQALRDDVRVPVRASRLMVGDEDVFAGWMAKIANRPAFSAGGRIELLRARLRGHIAMGLPVEYELGALNFTGVELLRSEYATAVMAELRAFDRAEAQPGSWILANPNYEAGRDLFARDVIDFRCGRRRQAFSAIASRARSMGIAGGWALEAGEYLKALERSVQPRLPPGPGSPTDGQVKRSPRNKP